MVQTADELYREYIHQHQQAHLDLGHLAFDVLQLRYPDLSCTNCFHPWRVSPRTPFGRFWTFYSLRYPALLYSQKTQEAFAILISVTNRSDIRISIRDIIFSCRYSTALPDPRAIAITLLKQYTHLLQLPTLSFEYQNAFDHYLDEPQTFSFEEPGEFSQYFGNLGSPILQATSVDNSVRITVLPEDTHHSYEPVDELPPYSEEVTHQTPPETHDTPSWIIGFDQQDILVSGNNSEEELESDPDHALDINLEDFFYTAPVYPLLPPPV